MDIFELCDSILEENKEALELTQQNKIKDDIVITILNILKKRCNTEDESIALNAWSDFKKELI